MNKRWLPQGAQTSWFELQGGLWRGVLESCRENYFSLLQTEEQKMMFGLDIKILKRLKIKTCGEKVIL